MAGIKIASNVLSNVLDHSCELYSVLVVEKFWQRHGPVEPGIEDVGFLGVVGGDQVVHGRNVAARSDFDLLARFDREWRQRVCFGANLVSGDGADGVHQPGVISEAENFLPGGGDSEFAIILDEGRAAQVERTKAVFDNVRLEDGAAFAEKCLTHALAVRQIR